MGKHLKRVMNAAKETQQLLSYDWKSSPLPSLPRESKLLRLKVDLVGTKSNESQPTEDIIRSIIISKAKPTPEKP